MNRLVLYSIALAAAFPAAAQDQPAPVAGEQPSTYQATPKLKTLIQDCDAHRFETTVQSVVDGQPHASKVKMCGVQGQTDSEWIDTLKDAIAKLEANSEMAATTREQIIAAVKTEIARLETAPSQPIASSDLPEGRLSDAQSRPLTSEYSVLPPLPNNPPPRAHILPPAEEAAAVAGGSPEETTPSPMPKPTETVAAPPVVQSAPVKPAAKPRLTLSCISPEFPAGGECVTLSRDTVLRVKAGEDIASGVSLRFLRSGEEHGVIELGSLRNRQSINYRLPSDVCSGVVTAEVQLEFVRNGQRVDRRGPYLLHC